MAGTIGVQMINDRKVWAAIDGGGTKTHLCACGREEQILFDKVYASTNYKAYSKEEVCAVMTAAWQEMCGKLGIDTAEVKGAVVSVAGCDSPQDETFYRTLMENLGMPSQRTFVCNDTEGIYRGMTQQKGICLVAGTGAIACAYDKEGQIARAGGWGAPLSDIGSGYWIGFRILQSFLMWLDGFAIPEDPVFLLLKDQFARENEALPWTVSNLSVAEIASVAVTACELAYGESCTDRGELCGHVLTDSQRCLAEHVGAVYRNSDLGDEFPLVMVGGLMGNERFYQALQERIRQELPLCRIRFLRPDGPPAIRMLRFCQRVFR